MCRRLPWGEWWSQLDSQQYEGSDGSWHAGNHQRSIATYCQALRHAGRPSPPRKEQGNLLMLRLFAVRPRTTNAPALHICHSGEQAAPSNQVTSPQEGLVMVCAHKFLGLFPERPPSGANAQAGPASPRPIRRPRPERPRPQHSAWPETASGGRGESGTGQGGAAAPPSPPSSPVGGGSALAPPPRPALPGQGAFALLLSRASLLLLFFLPITARRPARAACRRRRGAAGAPPARPRFPLQTRPRRRLGARRDTRAAVTGAWRGHSPVPSSRRGVAFEGGRRVLAAPGGPASCSAQPGGGVSGGTDGWVPQGLGHVWGTPRREKGRHGRGLVPLRS